MASFFLSIALMASHDPAWMRVELLSRGTELRVNSPNGASRRGFLVHADRQTLTLRVGQHEIPVDRRDIDRVAVNRGTHHHKNLTVAGLLAGGLVGAAIHQAGCSEQGASCSESTAVGFWPGALAGAVAGAALPSGDWTVIYSAPHRPQ